MFKSANIKTNKQKKVQTLFFILECENFNI